MDLSPRFGKESFVCPHCQVVSQQTWFDTHSASDSANRILSHIFYDYRTQISDYQQEAIADFLKKVQMANRKHMPEYIPDGFSIATCLTCNEISLWVNKEIVYPKKTPITQPNSDMDQEIQNLYIEASNIVIDSPKGATALLRLALQLLLKQLGKSGENINNDIKALVSDGLSPKIQQALDLLRVVGNNAVHPGQIDLNDGKEVALKLFQVLNFIADEMITKPKELELLYSEVVPDKTKHKICKRDGK